MAAQVNWRRLAEEKRRARDDLIPKQWILPNPPPADLLDVTHIPESAGILAEMEVEITNAPIEVLLGKIANMAWSAVEVTTAFAKRAIIAQQLVSLGLILPNLVDILRRQIALLRYLSTVL
jgi:amidase